MYALLQSTAVAPNSLTVIDFLADFVKFWQIIVFVFGAYQFWANRRERLAADKVREAQELLDSNYQAWLVVNSAQGKGGSGGRIDALTNLARNAQSLAGVNVDGAWLVGVDLRGADLAHASFKDANLQGALLSGANLKHANLEGANLSAAQLEGTMLQGARVSGARFSAASLLRADLADLVGWREIAAVNYARLQEIQRAPHGFREWAVEQGAEGNAVSEDMSAENFSTQFRAV
ncbi:pentapeptide repeat-containing protein [Gemmatimonas groenlandica]|uniref:Pentapeptide repeat-containing protein n=1 Tax=Gemmatimonas groenlandica TaxID=2732249 RepID=A0A6M4IV87_9BACT|nr:pentapeptide repeat-containing protein [Gemmatimonas groenlandica]QJR36722.1 pentapeptide repeat-containing protein [Gemmatimonas groenlandica]